MWINQIIIVIKRNVLLLVTATSLQVLSADMVNKPSSLLASDKDDDCGKNTRPVTKIL